MVAEDRWRPAGAALNREPGLRARETAERLEELLRAMVDENELHPTVEHVYAALCQAESRAAAAELRRALPR